MVMVRGLNITHSVVNTHYNTLFFFSLRKLIDIADRISHDSSPAIYKNVVTHGCNILVSWTCSELENFKIKEFWWPWRGNHISVTENWLLWVIIIHHKCYQVNRFYLFLPTCYSLFSKPFTWPHPILHTMMGMVGVFYWLTHNSTVHFKFHFQF